MLSSVSPSTRLHKKLHSHVAGQAALILVLVVGLGSILSSMALSSIVVSSVKLERDGQRSDAAWYAAWAGVDEVMYRLRAKQEFGVGVLNINLDLGGDATVSAEIETGLDLSQKTLRVTGYAGGAIRRLEVEIASSSGKASFIFAAQSGVGGFELEGNSQIVGANGGSGNVYSNGNILGSSKSSNNGSRILGTVWAVGKIGKLGTKQNEGVYITENAWAGELESCAVVGDVASPLPPVNCSYGGDFTLQEAPEPVPLSAIDVDYWKTTAEAGGVWVGNCVVGGSGGSDCTLGTNRLGRIKIDGDLTIPSNKSLVLDGAVWVDGDLNVSQNNTVTVGESFGKEAAVLVASDSFDNLAKGRILTQSNVVFARNSQGAGLIMISENRGLDCAANPAVKITSNTATVVFVAVDGCIYVGSNSVLAGVLGNKVHVSSNSTIEYDPSLASAILGTELGGWKVVGVREY